jgi:hypothetical protein
MFLLQRKQIHLCMFLTQQLDVCCDSYCVDKMTNVEYFLLGNSPAYEFYMPTFRNTVCSFYIGR